MTDFTRKEPRCLKKRVRRKESRREGSREVVRRGKGGPEADLGLRDIPEAYPAQRGYAPAQSQPDPRAIRMASTRLRAPVFVMVRDR